MGRIQVMTTESTEGGGEGRDGDVKSMYPAPLRKPQAINGRFDQEIMRLFR